MCVFMCVGESGIVCGWARERQFLGERENDIAREERGIIRNEENESEMQVRGRCVYEQI